MVVFGLEYSAKVYLKYRYTCSGFNFPAPSWRRNQVYGHLGHSLENNNGAYKFKINHTTGWMKLYYLDPYLQIYPRFALLLGIRYLNGEPVHMLRSAM